MAYRRRGYPPRRRGRTRRAVRRAFRRAGQRRIRKNRYQPIGWRL